MTFSISSAWEENVSCTMANVAIAGLSTFNAWQGFNPPRTPLQTRGPERPARDGKPFYNTYKKDSPPSGGRHDDKAE
jgi:hypothetical protein